VPPRGDRFEDNPVELLGFFEESIPGEAAQLWGAAETLRETIAMPIPPVERASYERAVTAARAKLGEKTFLSLHTPLH